MSFPHNVCVCVSGWMEKLMDNRMNECFLARSSTIQIQFQHLNFKYLWLEISQKKAMIWLIIK